ncbi:MAG TPA: hypothetical protein VMJ10_22130 [Kofleriaceae bacterium]|nr:hypothetical protein [Kofleriaceae bacterium]
MWRTFALALALAACGGATQVTPPPVVTPKPAPVRSQIQHRVYRTVVANPRASHATRTTFALTIDGGVRATLVEHEETVDGITTLEAADRAPAWTPRATRTYRGIAHVLPDATALDLESDGAQPLHVRCIAAAVDVLPAGARRSGDCAIAPAATSRVQVLACGEASQPAETDPDDDERLLFGDGVALEHATEVDGCETLRRMQ